MQSTYCPAHGIASLAACGRCGAFYCQRCVASGALRVCATCLAAIGGAAAARAAGERFGIAPIFRDLVLDPAAALARAERGRPSPRLWLAAAVPPPVLGVLLLAPLATAAPGLALAPERVLPLVLVLGPAAGVALLLAAAAITTALLALEKSAHIAAQVRTCLLASSLPGAAAAILAAMAIAIPAGSGWLPRRLAAALLLGGGLWSALLAVWMLSRLTRRSPQRVAAVLAVAGSTLAAALAAGAWLGWAMLR